MSERLKKIFESSNPKTKLVSYFVGCYPDYKTCLELIKEAIDNGVSIIECGYPTSEASAEGPVIKKAHDKVLENGDTIKDIGKIVDDLHTSGEEKEEAKQKITQILAQAEQAAQAQVSARWEADLKHGSWLSKNIRPITLIFLTGVFVILSVFDGNMGEFTIGSAYVPVYQTLLMTVYAAYFAGRSIEKVKKVTK